MWIVDRFMPACNSVASLSDIFSEFYPGYMSKENSGNNMAGWDLWLIDVRLSHCLTWLIPTPLLPDSQCFLSWGSYIKSRFKVPLFIQSIVYLFTLPIEWTLIWQTMIISVLFCFPKLLYSHLLPQGLITQNIILYNFSSYISTLLRWPDYSF